MSNIIKNTAIYTFGNILPKVGVLFLLPLITRYLTPSEYGIVQSLVILNTFLILLFTLAVDRGILRLYFDFEDNSKRRDYLGTIFISYLVISIIILILLFSFDFLIEDIYTTIDFYPYFSYFILSVFFNSFAIIPLAIFQVQEKAKFHLIFSILQVVFKYVFILWFVIYRDSGAVGMLKGMMIGNLILVPYCIYITLKEVNIVFKKDYFINNTKFSIPFIPGVIAAWIFSFSDRIFLEHYHSTNIVGIYSLGYQIAMVTGYLNQGVRKAYMPRFFLVANSLSTDEAKKKLGKYNETLLYFFSFIVFLVIIFSKEIIVLFFNSSYLKASSVIPIIAFTYLFIAASSLFGLSLHQKKKSHIVMGIILTTAGVNIGLNFLLIPKYGMMGAAASTLLSYVINTFLNWHYAKKEYYIKINFKKIIFVISLLLPIAIYLLYFLKLSLISLLLIKLVLVCLFGIFFYIKYKSTITAILLNKK